MLGCVARPRKDYGDLLARINHRRVEFCGQKINAVLTAGQRRVDLRLAMHLSQAGAGEVLLQGWNFDAVAPAELDQLGMAVARERFPRHRPGLVDAPEVEQAQGTVDPPAGAGEGGQELGAELPAPPRDSRLSPRRLRFAQGQVGESSVQGGDPRGRPGRRSFEQRQGSRGSGPRHQPGVARQLRLR